MGIPEDFMFDLNSPSTKEVSATIPDSPDFSVLNSVEDQYHTSLAEIANAAPTLLVFLRHFGCCFCREALSDIHVGLSNIECAGAKLVLVHMSSEDEASQILATYGLADVSRVSNPDQSLYRSFGLGRGSLDKLLSPRVLARAFEALVHGNPIGVSAGDGFQLPGVFLLSGGKIIQTFVPESPESRPDYLRIVSAAL
jgi:peroxiredoxin